MEFDGMWLVGNCVRTVSKLYYVPWGIIFLSLDWHRLLSSKIFGELSSTWNRNDIINTQYNMQFKIKMQVSNKHITKWIKLNKQTNKQTNKLNKKKSSAMMKRKKNKELLITSFLDADKRGSASKEREKERERERERETERQREGTGGKVQLKSAYSIRMMKITGKW